MSVENLKETPVAAHRDFGRFFMDEYRPVLRLAYALSGEVTAAEDITQEAFLAALRHWPRVAAYDNPAAWVRRVAANQAVSRRRRLRNEARAYARLVARRMPNEVSPLDQTSGSGWLSVPCRRVRPR